MRIRVAIEDIESADAPWTGVSGNKMVVRRAAWILRHAGGRAWFSDEAVAVGGKHTKRHSIRRLIGGAEAALDTRGRNHLAQPVFPVVAACTADAYDFSKLLPFLQRHFRLSPFICDDALHVQHVQFPSSLTTLFPHPGEIFFFQNGSFVFWSAAREDGDAVISALRRGLMPLLRPFEVSPHSEPELEDMSFKPTGASTGIVDEVIVLNDTGTSVKEKLAFSNGLADSVKLGTLETMLDEHIDKVRAIPSALRSGGKVPLSRKQVLGLTGELLHFRAQLNLNSDLLDTPDIYWSEPKLEELYVRISRVLETRRRTATLNKKLDYAAELAQVLGNHLGEQHGLKLEWGIIALIAVEVAFETIHLLERLL